MKSPIGPKDSPRSGFALVIVLCVIVLLVALAVGLIVRATSERSAASGYHASVLARQLADTATSLVQDQINAATTQGSNVDWVSQPGMVRTFDTSGYLIKAANGFSPSIRQSPFSSPGAAFWWPMHSGIPCTSGSRSKSHWPQ